MTKQLWICIMLAALCASTMVSCVTIPGMGRQGSAAADEAEQASSGGKVCVIAIASDEDARKAMEDLFVGIITNMEGKAVSSSSALRQDDLLLPQLVSYNVDDLRCEYVLIVHETGVDTSDEFEDPDYEFSPEFYYGGYHSYYRDMNGYLQAVKFLDAYTSQKVVAKLYDALNDKLLWNGETDAFKIKKADKKLFSAVQEMMEASRNE